MSITLFPISNQPLSSVLVNSHIDDEDDDNDGDKQILFWSWGGYPL